MIEVENLCFSYKEKVIFEDISFNLNKGEILSILGSNGSGKTTFIKCLSGVLIPTNGSCKLTDEGSNVSRVSYVPQAKKINFSYNVVEFVSFGCSVLNPYFAKPTVEDFIKSKKVLSNLGIKELCEKNINEISGGELQMCYIAKALVSNPDILILDEPEANLDFKNQAKIINLIFEIAKCNGTTVIINTHFLNYAKKISDRCLIMKKGSYKFGNPNEILQEKTLEKFYEVGIKKCFYYENNEKKETFVVG
ncbi:ABC transporter ATP-binding protein [Enterococcus gilvus]|uniref:ABC transporter ATP-binding protein n=1 Tax=Enterococcus gilvus TaxID=160453 RepID=UPI003ED8C45C